MASSPCTCNERFSTPSRRQMLTPMPFGRSLARWARMPVTGQSGLPRGRRAPRHAAAASARWNRYTTSMWLKPSRPIVASGSSTSGSRSMRLSTASQSSSVGVMRLDRTTPIGSTLKRAMGPQARAESGLDGGAVAADHPPDLVTALALGVAGRRVLGVRVQRLAADGELRRAVGAGDRGQLAGDPGAGGRCAGDGGRRPGLGAGTSTRRGAVAVLGEDVERVALGVGEDLAVRAVDQRDGGRRAGGPARRGGGRRHAVVTARRVRRRGGG